ncbi:MAG: hypothetical protein V8R40_03850 [Dysosmobacter sp.]
MEAEFQKLADQYGMDLETVKKYLQAEQVRDQVISRKAVAVVVDSATAIKPRRRRPRSHQEGRRCCRGRRGEEARQEDHQEKRGAEKKTRSPLNPSNSGYTVLWQAGTCQAAALPARASTSL